MAVTTERTNNGDGTITYTIDVTAPQAKADAMAEDAAKRIYQLRKWALEYDGEDVKPFDNLTNAQKLALLGKEAKRHLVALAKQYHIMTETDATHATAVADAETMYEIED